MIFILGFILLIPIFSVQAMEVSPESSRISRELQKRRAEELKHNAQSPTSSYIIQKKSDELDKNPKFKEAIGRTEFNPAQLKRLNERWDNKFKKLQREHRNQMEQYTSITIVFCKIMIGGFGIQGGYWLSVFPYNYEREWWGAALGITTVGVLGYCYGMYQRQCIASCPPTRSDALNLISKKDTQ